MPDHTKQDAKDILEVAAETARDIVEEARDHATKPQVVRLFSNGNTKWIMGIIASVIVVGFSAWLTSINSSQARVVDDIGEIEASIAALNENKDFNKAQFIQINNRLDKVDTKLDALLLRK